MISIISDVSHDFLILFENESVDEEKLAVSVYGSGEFNFKGETLEECFEVVIFDIGSIALREHLNQSRKMRNL